jgi:D-glycero-alpha-D-manno-heptose-7-phosphate kinase
MPYRAKAPFRLGLAGGGTDLHPYCDEFGGCVLNATIGMYAHCTIEETTDGTVCFQADENGRRLQLDARSGLPIDGHLDLHKGVYNRIVRDFNGGRPLSYRMTTYGDAPPGSGLGTSSTMVVAMLGALSEWLKLPLGEYDIARLAFLIERRDIGFAGGKQDQYAAAFGGFNYMEFFAGDKVIVNPLRIKGHIINELEESILLYYTGISRSSAQIITEQTRNLSAHDAASLEAMHQLKTDAQVTKEALLTGNINALISSVGNSWESKKRTASQISTGAIEAIIRAAMQAGAHGAKMSGAGGGGFIMFFVDPPKRTAVAAALSACGGAVVPFRFVQNGVESWKAR